MTVEQAAQNLGVSAETLVQEVISKQTAWHALCTVVIVLAFLVTVVRFIYNMRNENIDDADIRLIFVVITAVLLFSEGKNCVDWLLSPESTAREYIAETYGENARWK